MTEYVVGLCFSENRKNILLIRKNRPEWQAGKLNGVGGKLEEGESPRAAMTREFQEEAGVSVATYHWTHFATLSSGEKWRVYVFKTFTDRIMQAEALTDEELEIVPVEDLYVHSPLPSVKILVIAALEEQDFLNIEYANTDKP